VIRVLVVGNVALFRSALAATLANEHDLDVVGEIDSAGDLRAAAADVAVVDLEPAGPASAPTVYLPGCTPPRSVVVLTTKQAPKHLRCVHADHIRGVVAKDGGVDQLVRAVRRVAAGERVIEPARAATTGLPAGNPLTDREVEVLRLAAEGRSSARIADDLGLTIGTVRNYMSAIIRKAGVRNRLEAIRTAGRAGWL
jgi:two-component system response regulator DesR